MKSHHSSVEIQLRKHGLELRYYNPSPRINFSMLNKLFDRIKRISTFLQVKVLFVRNANTKRITDFYNRLYRQKHLVVGEWKKRNTEWDLVLCCFLFFSQNKLVWPDDAWSQSTSKKILKIFSPSKTFLFEA